MRVVSNDSGAVVCQRSASCIPSELGTGVETLTSEEKGQLDD